MPVYSKGQIFPIWAVFVTGLGDSVGAFPIFKRGFPKRDILGTGQNQRLWVIFQVLLSEGKSLLDALLFLSFPICICSANWIHLSKRKAMAAFGFLQAGTGAEGWFVGSITLLRLEPQALCRGKRPLWPVSQQELRESAKAGRRKWHLQSLLEKAEYSCT